MQVPGYLCSYFMQCLYFIYSFTVNPVKSCQCKQDEKSKEPPCFPKRRNNAQLQCCNGALLPFCIFGFYFECIITGRQIIIDSFIKVCCCLPVFINSFKHIII